MQAPHLPTRRKAPWYVPAWYNSVRTFRGSLDPLRRLRSIVVPEDRSPSCPSIMIDPAFPDAGEPQAWEIRLPDGSTEWYYNCLGAAAEASARGMRLPVEQDWETVSTLGSPAVPSVDGGFPGAWFPSR